MIVSLEDGQIEGTLKRKGHMQKDIPVRPLCDLYEQHFLLPIWCFILLFFLSYPSSIVKRRGRKSRYENEAIRWHIGNERADEIRSIIRTGKSMRVPLFLFTSKIGMILACYEVHPKISSNASKQ